MGRRFDQDWVLSVIDQVVRVGEQLTSKEILARGIERNLWLRSYRSPNPAQIVRTLRHNPRYKDVSAPSAPKIWRRLE